MLAASRRLHIGALVIGMAGCTGLIEEDIPEGISPEQEAARKAWVAGAQPVLETNCQSCHGGSRPEVAWLEGSPDVYAERDDLMMYTKMIVDFNEPQTSDLIKHGLHEGPALTAGQASKVLEWIQKERDAQAMGNSFPVMTTPLTAMMCTAGAPGSATCPYTEFPLDTAGAAGAKVQFTAMNVSGALYLSNLKIVPGTAGVYAEHPIFVSVPAMGMPKFDSLDRYQSVMLNLPANAPAAMQQLGTGTASFVDFLATEPVAVYFKAVGPMK